MVADISRIPNKNCKKSKKTKLNKNKITFAIERTGKNGQIILI